MNKIILFLLFNLFCALAVPFDANAGIDSISGIVRDKESGAPLPLVMVLSDDSRSGIFTDIDGRFVLNNDSGIKKLRFSCSGYKPVVVGVTNSEKPLSVFLQAEVSESRNQDIALLAHSADHIIKQAIHFREKHNPINLKSYSCSIRDRVVMAPYGDTLLWSDNLRNDAADKRSRRLMDERSLYINESVWSKRRLPSSKNEDVLISSNDYGFKDPMFLYLITQFQSISFFYDDVTIGNKIYLNPLSSSGLSKYSFVLIDTLVARNRKNTTFMIAFAPKKDTLFNGLKGSFFINSDGWAVSGLKAEPADKEGFFDVVLYQLSEKREGVWFPVQFRSDLVFKNNKIGKDSLARPLAGCNRRFLDDVKLFDKAVPGNEGGNLNDKLLSGRLKAGWFSFETGKFIRYNKFEGLSLGLGGHTNSDFSTRFTVGGYANYGFKNTKTKYDSDVSVWIDQHHRSELNLSYSYDTRESGGSRFFDEQYGILNSSGYRFFYVNHMDYERKMILSLKTHFDISTLFLGLQHRIIERGYDINNGTEILLPDNYNCSGFVAGIKIASGDVFEGHEQQMISLRSRYPVFWFQYTKGVKNFMEGGFNYNRYESKISFDLVTPRLGKSSFLLTGNSVDGPAPYFEYFNGRGTYGPWGLFASGSFVTMHPDEFLADRFFGLFYTHNFGKIFSKQSVLKIEPALAFNYGWGELKNRPAGYFLPGSDCSKGYLETGLQINNLIDLKVYNIGLGTYYRMGAYSYTTVKNNLVFKIVINFDKP